MQDTLLEYKCPNCGGKLEFDSGAQNMKCPYCDAEFDVEALKDLDEELKQVDADDLNGLNSAHDNYSDEESAGLRSYVCNSCGGEIICDETCAATHCPFCGNPVIMKGQLSGELRPELVIPFKLDKKAAVEALKRHLTGKKLLPKVFRDENHIEEVKGVYVPVWLFDADVDADIHYRATKVRVWSDSDYNYTETSHFSVRRRGSLSFQYVPVDGSSKMPDELMESIEPYNMADAVDFQTAYLSGYLANRYDVTAEDSVGRAGDRMRNCAAETFRGTVNGYTTVALDKCHINTGNGKSRYVLYPVWLLNTEWRGEKYLFAMNGQTGKFVGDLPLDKGAYMKWLLGITASVGVLVGLILTIANLL